MTNVFVNHWSYALGDEAYTVEEAAAMGRIRSSAAALKEAGFARHRVCRPHTTAYELARRAVEKIRGRLGDVGAIVYATCIPCNANIGEEKKFRETGDVKHLMDFPAGHLQRDFGLERATAIGINQQACTGKIGRAHV